MMIAWDEFTKKPELLNDMRNKIILSKGKNKIRYYNVPVSFDIETSSWYEENGDEKIKRAAMYIWAMSIDGIRIYGRTWEDFRKTLFYLQNQLELNQYQRLMIFIHNLSYEFQFLIGQVQISQVFARKRRHPIKCLIQNKCFELRCSYFLSGLSLQKVAADLQTPIRKKIGDLDYTILRHWKTPLTETEMKYVEYDVLILHYFIKEEIEKNNKDISQIPLTKTGYVRKYCRDYIKKTTNWKAYREMIKKEAASDPDLFIILNKAFAGGYTHANFTKIQDIPLSNVHSIDFASSYPAVMVAEKYPRGRFKQSKITTKEQFYKFVERKACVFEIRLQNVYSKSDHHIWSKSKCVMIEDGIFDNGRIDYCTDMMTYMTDVDFKIFSLFYEFDLVQIGAFYWTNYDYLPKPIIECVLNYYKDKTELKGLENKIAEYFVAKGMVNGIYGMMVTNPLNDEIIFDEDEWNLERPDMKEALERVYLKNPNTFLSYQWGVWITAHARYNLLSQLWLMGDDAIYCDTDSIKLQNYEKYKDVIEEYNKNVTDKIRKTLEHFDIPFELSQPEDIENKVHPLGVWDYEGKYEQFKTLGAKRYCYTKVNKKGEVEFHITVSGIPNVTEEEYEDENGEIKMRKIEFCPTAYIESHGEFDFFRDEMVIPAEYSRRLVHTYREDPFEMEVEDYLGNKAVVSEKCYIHMERTKYKMSFSEDFANYLIGENDEITVKRIKRDELAINPWQVGVKING